MFLVHELIKKKRDGGILSQDEIGYLIKNYTLDKIPDYQMAAFCMAVFFSGMTPPEKTALTLAMAKSGQTLDLSFLPYSIDKHSTGGVGDKTSFIIAPIVASLGIPVPMISGRGLGHTGGTLDKLESIPGFLTQLETKKFISIVKDVGTCIIGQTEHLVPADKKLYSLRDVTGTIDSLPLITSSILSKKIATGVHGLVLDVKVGNGSFMKTQPDAEALAKSLIETGTESGLDTIAYITNMSEPLGHKIGNYLEIEEAIDCLQRKGPNDLMHVVHLLSGTMIFLAQKVKTISEGIQLSKKQLNSGKAWNTFKAMVEAQGGRLHEFFKTSSKECTKQVTITSNQEGIINSIDTYNLGRIVTLIGGGRKKITDLINHHVGIVVHQKVGSYVYRNQPLATLYVQKKEESLVKKIQKAFCITLKKKKPTFPVFSKVTSKGIESVETICNELLASLE